MTGKKIVWGQDLGTNSKSSSATFINSYNTTTNWPKGKYGYSLGHKVGAYISRTVNKKMLVYPAIMFFIRNRKFKSNKIIDKYN